MPVFLPEVFPQKETGLIRVFHSSLLWFSPKTAGYSLGLIRLKKAERQSKIKQGRWKAVLYIMSGRMSGEKDYYSSG
jgi:hypothetical protein